MSGRSTVDTKNTANVNTAIVESPVEVQYTVLLPDTLVSTAVDTRNTANVNTVIVKCQVEVQ